MQRFFLTDAGKSISLLLLSFVFFFAFPLRDSLALAAPSKHQSLETIRRKSAKAKARKLIVAKQVAEKKVTPKKAAARHKLAKTSVGKSAKKHHAKPSSLRKVKIRRSQTIDPSETLSKARADVKLPPGNSIEARTEDRVDLASQMPAAKLVEAGPVVTREAVDPVDTAVTLPVKPTDVEIIPPGPNLRGAVIKNIAQLRMIEDGTSVYTVDSHNRRIYLTIDPFLQHRADEILERYRVPWGAVVAINPKTGRVLAYSGHSEVESGGSDVLSQATFPAASLFKLITASAAIERTGLGGKDIIRYRGGDHMLGKKNYMPNASLDRRMITFEDALAKSVNPAFARVALENRVNQTVLSKYAQNFGFNSPIPFDTRLDTSHFDVGDDTYDLARTAAGYGDAFISPVHAALIAASIANGGKMMRPYLVSKIVGENGQTEYQSPQPSVLRYPILSSTAQRLLNMMKATVEIGTARKHFWKLRKTILRNVEVAGKTGTLSGENPKGRYTWFIAAAPADDPEIALAALVIDPGGARIKGTGIGSYLLEQYFSHRHN